MKKKVVKDEMWPVFYLEPEDYQYSFMSEIDIPEDKLQWITRANTEYYNTQQYIKELMEGTAGLAGN